MIVHTTVLPYDIPTPYLYSVHYVGNMNATPYGGMCGDGLRIFGRVYWVPSGRVRAIDAWHWMSCSAEQNQSRSARGWIPLSSDAVSHAVTE